MAARRPRAIRSNPALFLDTAYVNALVNPRDRWHAVALSWERRLAAESRPLVSTEFVLLEIADGLAAVRFRAHAAQVIDALQTSSLAEIVPASPELIASAVSLYPSRADKYWGLTDCSSFVVMNERGLYDALTTDEHFQQAGFRPLLLEPTPGA